MQVKPYSYQTVSVVSTRPALAVLYRACVQFEQSKGPDICTFPVTSSVQRSTHSPIPCDLTCLRCSADALYSNAGRTRPLTPMPALKPPGTGPLSAFLQQPDSAAVADGAPQPTAAGDAAAGRCQNIGSQVGTSTAAAAATAAAMPAGSLFGAAGGAAAAPGPSTAGLFPGNVNIRQSAAAFTARPASRSGFFGSSSAGVGAAPSTWAGLGSSGSMQSIPSLLGAPVPAAPKPVLGLPKAKSNRAPLMGSKRGAAGGVGPRGLAAAGAGAAAGSLKPMRNTPLKIGLPALGSKRASDLQGPSVLDTGVIGKWPGVLTMLNTCLVCKTPFLLKPTFGFVRSNCLEVGSDFCTAA